MTESQRRDGRWQPQGSRCIQRYDYNPPPFRHRDNLRVRLAQTLLAHRWVVETGMQVFGFQDEVLSHNRLLTVCSMEQQHWQTWGECCVVQSLSGAWLCDPMDCSPPGFPCPSLFTGICSNSGSLRQRCYPTTSSSATLFSSHPQSSQHQGLFQ